jgi:hypothetical protein
MQLQTRSFFDSRPDARHFVADVDGVVVSIRQNLPTYGVTDGEVWIAFRLHDRLVERRFGSVDRAKHDAARFVRDAIGTRADSPTIGAWIAIRRAEYAIACPICAAAPTCPCVDEDGAQMLEGKGTALVVGAPHRPEMHEVEVNLPPLVHGGRATAFHHSLHGAPKPPPPGYRPERIFIK